MALRMEEARDPLATHYRLVVKAMSEGRVVPLLGAGANLCGRPEGAVFDAETREWLPDGNELADYLATEFYYPDDDTRELQRVSQYAAEMAGRNWLYDKLHEIFDADFAPSPLHVFLARLPGVLREKGYGERYQLIVTTNYDDALERAFARFGEPFDLVWYVAEGEHRGKFMHRPPDGEAELVERTNERIDLAPEKRTVILKVHGAVTRATPTSDDDSYVITEDNYIDYLTRSTDPAMLVPIGITDTMRESQFLFLGYSLRDWNLRVLLQRVWQEQRLVNLSWAVQLSARPYEKKYWANRHVELVESHLDRYVNALERWLEELPRRAV
jgi:hypothetical protein